MTSRRIEILTKIQKILALTTSPNVHEARSARRQANALKRKHKITPKELEHLIKEELPIDAGPLGACPYWRLNLSLAVKQYHHCSISMKHGRLFFAGKNAATAVAQYLYLATEIEIACLRSWRTNPASNGVNGALAKVWFTMFRAEAVRSIARRLVRDAVSDSSTAATTSADPLSNSAPLSSSTQQKRSMAEVRELVVTLAPHVGETVAELLVKDVVQRAGAAGLCFGAEIYLGEKRLLMNQGTASTFFVRG